MKILWSSFLWDTAQRVLWLVTCVLGQPAANLCRVTSNKIEGLNQTAAEASNIVRQY